MESHYHVINVYVKTRKELWDDNDEIYYKYLEDSFVIDCDDKTLEILYELNNYKENEGVISCLKIPDLINAHLEYSLELDWNDDDVMCLQTELQETVEYDN